MKCKICKKTNDWPTGEEGEIGAMIQHLRTYHFSKYVDCIRRHFDGSLSHDKILNQIK